MTSREQSDRDSARFRFFDDLIHWLLEGIAAGRKIECSNRSRFCSELNPTARQSTLSGKAFSALPSVTIRRGYYHVDRRESVEEFSRKPVCSLVHHQNSENKSSHYAR